MKDILLVNVDKAPGRLRFIFSLLLLLPPPSGKRWKRRRRRRRRRPSLPSSLSLSLNHSAGAAVVHLSLSVFNRDHRGSHSLTLVVLVVLIQPRRHDRVATRVTSGGGRGWGGATSSNPIRVRRCHSLVQPSALPFSCPTFSVAILLSDLQRCHGTRFRCSAKSARARGSGCLAPFPPVLVFLLFLLLFLLLLLSLGMRKEEGREEREATDAAVKTHNSTLGEA